MAARIKVGVGGSPEPPHPLLQTLDVLEVEDTFREPPGIETARRWREAVPAGLEFTARAWRRITDDPGPPRGEEDGREVAATRHNASGFFRPTEAVFAAWARTREVCETLGVTTIVFESPPSFVPSPEHRDNLYAFFRRAETRLVRAWEPPVEWPVHVVERICEDLGLQHATDPFTAELVDQPRAYYRLRRGPPGRDSSDSYTGNDLAQLLRYCDDVDEAYVIFGNSARFDDAQRFRELVDQR